MPKILSLVLEENADVAGVCAQIESIDGVLSVEMITLQVGIINVSDSPMALTRVINRIKGVYQVSVPVRRRLFEK